MSEYENNKKEYKVGYSKPPEYTRFQSGRSGNPKGRPKATRKFSSRIEKEMNSKMNARIGEEVVSLSKFEMTLKRLFQKAHEGHMPSIRMIMELATKIEKEKPENASQQNTAIGIPAMLAAAKQRLKEKEEREEKKRRRLESERLTDELLDNSE